MGSDKKQNDDSPGSGVLPGREQTSLWEKSCSAPPRSGGGLAGDIKRLSHSVSKRLVWFERSAGKTPSFERGAPKVPSTYTHCGCSAGWGAAPAAPEARSQAGLWPEHLQPVGFPKCHCGHPRRPRLSCLASGVAKGAHEAEGFITWVRPVEGHPGATALRGGQR